MVDTATPPAEEKPVDVTAGIFDAITSGVEATKPEAAVTPPVVDTEAESAEQKAERETAEAAAAEALKNETPEQKTAREAKEAETAAARAAETPEQKTAREAKEAEAALKKMDPIKDPIPATAAPRTRERIQQLINLNKEKDTALEEGRVLFKEIADTGVTPEHFATTLNMLRHFNSDKIEDKRQALEFLQVQVAFLAKQVGEVLPGEDILSEFADLKNHVTAGTLTQEHAEEIAKGRRRAAVEAGAKEQQTQQQTQAEQQLEQEKTIARSALNGIGATLSAVDPDYATKAPLVIAKLGPVFATTHPSKWVQMFQDEYKALPKAAPPAASAAAALSAAVAKPGAQPMRPNKQPAGGGGNPAPKSMGEAIEAGLASMRG